MCLLLAIAPEQPSATEQSLSTSIASKVSSENTAERFARMAIDELEKSQLVHQDESSYGVDPSKSCDAMLDFVGLGHKMNPTCRSLTRKMTKAESQSEKGQAAVAKAMHKMAVENSSFGTPIEATEAPAGSTVSGICTLTHIKNFERAVEEWVWKGRAVILGNTVRPIHSSHKRRGRPSGRSTVVASCEDHNSTAAPFRIVKKKALS